MDQSDLQTIAAEPLTEGEQANFETLRKAFANDDVALVRSADMQTGERVALVCAVYRDDENLINMVPLGMLTPGVNPYERFVGPADDIPEG